MAKRKAQVEVAPKPRTPVRLLRLVDLREYGPGDDRLGAVIAPVPGGQVLTARIGDNWVSPAVYDDFMEYHVGRWHVLYPAVSAEEEAEAFAEWLDTLGVIERQEYDLWNGQEQEK